MIRKILCILFATTIMGCAQRQGNTIPKPIFIDPNYQGSCDPEIVYNRSDELYYIYYTARRSGKRNTFLQTPIGVASSQDLANWKFEGYCRFDGQHDDKDADATFWAPAIIATKDSLHMFATFKPDTLTTKGAWGGKGSIVHYATSLNNPVNGWQKMQVMHADTLSTLDASTYWVDDTAHLWFMAKNAMYKTQEYTLIHRTTKDFDAWETIKQPLGDVYNKSVTGIGYEEAPYIFLWKGSYWLMTDPHNGFAIYKSEDATYWKFQGYILKEPGTGKMDVARARHGSVLIKNDRAFLFYHVEYNRDYEGEPIFKQSLENRKSALQMAELKLVKGKLVCDRDKDIVLAKD
ncbi:MAG: family 43 glycosylhydrolase [Bacteroidota bacterium]